MAAPISPEVPSSPAQSRESAIRSLEGVKDTGLTAEQNAFVTEVKKRAAEDPRSATERISQGVEQQPKPVPQGEVDQVVNANTRLTGKEIRVGTKTIHVEDRSKIINRYIEKGITGITRAEQTMLLGELRNQLQNVEDIKVMLDNLPTGTNRDVFLNDMIKPLLESQRGREIISDLFSGAMKPERIIARQQYQEAEKVLASAKLAVTQEKQAWDTTNNEHTTKSARLDEFKPGGKATLDLDKSSKERPANQAKLAVNHNQQGRLDARLNTLNQELQGINPRTPVRTETDIEIDIKNEEVQLSTLVQEANNLQEQIDLPDKLQQEWDRLKLEVPTLTDKQKVHTETHVALLKEQNDLETEVQIAERFLKNSEEGYKREVAGMFNEAMMGLLQEKVAQNEQKQQEYIEELKKTASTRAEKDLLDAYMNRWATGKVRGRLFGKWGGRTEVTILNREKTKEDFDKLFTTNPDGSHNLNPDAIKDLVTNMLKIPPKTPPYTDEEINRVLESDNFKQNIMPQVLEGLIARKMQADPKGLSPREADLILSAPWGENVIDNALKKNPGAQAKIDALRAKGVITGSTAEWLRKQGGKSVLLFLLSLLGGAAAVLAAPAIPIIGATGLGIASGLGAVASVPGMAQMGGEKRGLF